MIGQLANRKALLAIIALAGTAAIICLQTDLPCGMLRDRVRKEAETQGRFGKLVSMLPNTWIDGFISMQFGVLTPGRCTALLLGIEPKQPPAASNGATQNDFNTAPQSSFSSNEIRNQGVDQSVAQLRHRALEIAQQAITNCRQRRLSGELASFEASAQCSNPAIIQAFQSLNYPHMDIVWQFADKRLRIAEEVDQGVITEDQFNSRMLDSLEQLDAEDAHGIADK